MGEKGNPSAQISQAIAEIASRQHGNVTRKQLLALGMPARTIADRVDKGHLYPVHAGVYAVGRPARVPLERAAAAVLACGPAAMLSHESALSLWGIRRHWGAAPFHVAVPTGDRRPPGITVHRPASLARADVRYQLGIRATSPARTLLDCAPRLSAKALTRAVNDARLARILTPDQLRDVLTRNPRHLGARPLQAVDLPARPTRSPFENDFAAFCAHFALPKPQTNALVAGHEVDAFFPEHGLIVELDGWDFRRTREAFESDRERDAQTLAAGFPTLRITRPRLAERARAEADRLRAILAARLGG